MPERLFGIVGWIVLSMACLAHQASAGANVLVVCDIHFNPFAQCYAGDAGGEMLALALNDNPGTWKFAPVAQSTYGQDTTIGLLDSGLDEIHREAVAHHVEKVFVCGDLLEHHFRGDFGKYVGEQDLYTRFSSNVVRYVLDRIRSATCGAEIYYVPGNNDTDRGDYSFPTKEFLSNVATSLFDSGTSEARETFCDLGYSCLPFNDTVQVIGLNCNLLPNWGANTALAAQQLALLQSDLEACSKSGKHAIILMHEPFGIDVYSTFITKRLVPFMNQALQQKYMDVMLKHSQIISEVFAAHCHREYFESAGGKMPIVGTVALNCCYRNNPGFKIATLDSETGRLLDYTTWYEDLSQQRWSLLYNFHQTYNPSNRSLIDVINEFPEDVNAPEVKSLRRFFNALSPISYPLSSPELWPLFYAGLAHLDAKSYVEYLNSNFPDLSGFIGGAAAPAGSPVNR